VRKLLEVTHDSEADALYLYYSHTPITHQLNLHQECSLNVDLDANDEVVGIELLSPTNIELEMLVRFANEHDLSLEGLFEVRKTPQLD